MPMILNNFVKQEQVIRTKTQNQKITNSISLSALVACYITRYINLNAEIEPSCPIIALNVLSLFKFSNNKFSDVNSISIIFLDNIISNTSSRIPWNNSKLSIFESTGISYFFNLSYLLDFSGIQLLNHLP